jgi:hypothetical protein
MSWLTIVQNILTNAQTLVPGMITIMVICGAVYAMIHGHWAWFWTIIGGGGIAVTATWMVTTFYGT